MEFKNVPEKPVFENINFGPAHKILVLITLANNEGSDEILQSHQSLHCSYTQEPMYM